MKIQSQYFFLKFTLFWKGLCFPVKQITGQQDKNDETTEI